MKKIFGFIRCLFCVRFRCRTRYRIGKKTINCGVGEITFTCPKDPEE